jgi:putative ABC transport system permease protein
MPTLRVIGSRLLGLASKRRQDARLTDEIQAHLDLLAADYVRRGLSLAEARAAARREFGGVDQVKEIYREQSGIPMLEDLWQDVRVGVRGLRRTPGFSLAAIAALALGIGTSTAMFSVVNRVLLNPFAYPDPERMVMFQNTYQRFNPTGSASPTEFNWWRQQTGAFQDVSAYVFSAANLTGESFPELIPTMRVSADFLRLCGANAIYGRTFTAADDVPNAPQTAVLAYGFWQRHFGSGPEVIGRRIILSGTLHEVIGVMGPDLSDGQISEQSMGSGDLHIREPPDVYLPFQLDPNSTERGHYFNVAGRLKPGVNLAVANQQLQASYHGYARTWPDPTPGTGFRVQLLRDAIVGEVRPSLLILLAAVMFVLLMACANVANLLLARVANRRREFAIRGAVGAGRLRLVRQLLTESVLLSLSGGVLGVAAGYTGIRVLLALSPGNIPRIGADGSNVVLDLRVLGFALALSILTPIIFGLVPALSSSRADLSTTLKEGGNRTGTGWRQSKTRVVLVTVEMALAVVLLIVAALLIRTFVAVRHVNPGFDARNVLTMRMLVAGPQFETAAGMTQVLQEGVRRIRALPGVEVASTSCCVPLVDRFFGSFRIAGRPEGVTSLVPSGWTVVSPGYFETFNIPVVRGRTFTDRDDIGPRTVVINEALARRVWPNSDPTNDRVIIGDGEPRQIVGVVKDVLDAVTAPPQPNIYTLSAHLDDKAVSLMLPTSPWAWLIRTRVAPRSLSSVIQNELRQASGGLPVARITTMDEILSRATARENFNMLVLAVFGFAALLLAAVGIYGLMAYSVAQRTEEIAVRLALGAESSRIRNMVVIQGLRPVVVGMVCGVAAAFGLTRLLSSILFGVQPRDPLVFLVAPTALVGIALVAVWLPAIRATRIDPIQSLRS